MYATTPGAEVAAPGGDYCGNPMFMGMLQPGHGDYTFVSPDVYAQWQGNSCNDVLARGTAVPVDLELTLDVPLRCGGLTCEAYWDPTHIVSATYVP